MALVNYSLKRLAAKIVYYGPGLGGKTTNLRYIHANTTVESRGEMVSLDTAADRTLYFDLLPIEVGNVAGFSTRLQLYTVPGQVYYNTTRQLVLKGVDGVVFVADSRRPMLEANIESLTNLQHNLAQMGERIPDLPVVLQYNKRDLPDVCSVEELDATLNSAGLPRFEAVAVDGVGVFETLTEITRRTLLRLRNRLSSDGTAAPATAPRSAAEAAPQPQAAAAAEPEPAAASAAPASAAPAAKARASGDPMAQLEALRQQALGGALPASRNGHDTIQRSVRLDLSREQLQRAQRLSLQLIVEDGERHAIEAPLDLAVDLEPRPSLEEVLLRLQIQVSGR